MTDPRTLRLVALLIGLVAFTCVSGGILLLAQGKPADAALFGLAGTSLGYLVGLFTPSPTTAPMPVTGLAGGPVEVEAVDSA